MQYFVESIGEVRKNACHAVIEHPFHVDFLIDRVRMKQQASVPDLCRIFVVSVALNDGPTPTAYDLNCL